MSLRLDWCSHSAALYAVKRWHYSRALPTPPLVKIGAWEHGRFIGCVLFSRGATGNLGKPYGLRQTECCELTRVALTNHETPVTRILSIAIKMLRRRAPGLRLIVSFADPNAGHVGTIYQAGGWIYTGATSRSSLFRDDSGRMLHGRQVSVSGRKVQYGEVRATPLISECERVRQLGKHRYVFALDAAMREHVEQFRRSPPRAGSIGSDASADQAGEGGATPTPALLEQSA